MKTVRKAVVMTLLHIRSNTQESSITCPELRVHVPKAELEPSSTGFISFSFSLILFWCILVKNANEKIPVIFQGLIIK